MTSTVIFTPMPMCAKPAVNYNFANISASMEKRNFPDPSISHHLRAHGHKEAKLAGNMSPKSKTKMAKEGKIRKIYFFL